jgi:hypothetical protein
MNDRDRAIELVNKRDRVFDNWRQGPKVDYMITKMETENLNIRGIEALLRSASEAGWIGGQRDASE